MGMAELTIKATFRTVAELDAASAKLATLIAENAEDWWQEHRCEQRADWWDDFKARFPVTCEVLAQPDAYGKVRLDDPDTDNGLAGWLCFVDAAFVWDHYLKQDIPRPVSRPEVQGKSLTYRAVTWYWAMWTPFARWLLALGASRVLWESPQGKFTLDSAVLAA